MKAAQRTATVWRETKGRGAKAAGRIVAALQAQGFSVNRAGPRRQ